MTIRKSWIAAAALAVCVTSARGDYFPIVDGHEWQYEEEDWSPGTEHYAMVFDGTAVVNGELTHRLRQVGGLYDGYETYWSRDASGDVYWHSPDFDAPVLYLDMPLFVGKVWSTTVQASWGAHARRFRVEGQGSVSVPAGTFECFHIALWSDDIYFATESYAENIGLVQKGEHDPYRLARLASLPGPVAVESTTWSGVRQMYR
jgi:hypothetical protein